VEKKRKTDQELWHDLRLRTEEAQGYIALCLLEPDDPEVVGELRQRLDSAQGAIVKALKAAAELDFNTRWRRKTRLEDLY
jgi:hypothetical protein